MRVEFYLTDANEVSHFAPIARELLAMGVDARFVSSRNDPKWYDAGAAEAWLTKLRLPFVPLPDVNADLALTTYLPETLQDYRDLRARMMYGISLTRSFSVLPPAPKWHAGFDLLLVHGPLNRRTSGKYMRADQIRMIGYPRFDAWFNESRDSKLLRKQHGVIEPSP